MAAEIVTITYQLKRWIEGDSTTDLSQHVLKEGEPIVIYLKDGSTRMKVGDGKSTVDSLPYIGEERIISKNSYLEFPNIGEVNVIYKEESTCKLYQWNPNELKYESLGEAELDIDDVDCINGGTAAELLVDFI